MIGKYIKLKTRILFFAYNSSKNHNEYVQVKDAKIFLKVPTKNQALISNCFSQLASDGLIIWEKNKNYSLTPSGINITKQLIKELSIENLRTLDKPKIMDLYLDTVEIPIENALKEYFEGMGSTRLDPDLVNLLTDAVYIRTEQFFEDIEFLKKSN